MGVEFQLTPLGAAALEVEDSLSGGATAFSQATPRGVGDRLPETALMGLGAVGLAAFGAPIAAGVLGATAVMYGSSDNFAQAANEAYFRKSAAFRKLFRSAGIPMTDEAPMSKDDFDLFYGHTGLQYNPDDPLTQTEAEFEASAMLYAESMDNLNRSGQGNRLMQFVGSVAVDSMLDPSTYVSYGAGSLASGVLQGANAGLRIRRAANAAAVVADIATGIAVDKTITEATGVRDYTVQDAAYAVALAGGMYTMGHMLSSKYAAARAATAKEIDAGGTVSFNKLETAHQQLELFPSSALEGAAITPRGQRVKDLGVRQEMLAPKESAPAVAHHSESGTDIEFSDGVMAKLHGVAEGSEEAMEEMTSLMTRLGIVDEVGLAAAQKAVKKAAKVLKDKVDNSPIVKELKDTFDPDQAGLFPAKVRASEILEGTTSVELIADALEDTAKKVANLTPDTVTPQGAAAAAKVNKAPTTESQAKGVQLGDTAQQKVEVYSQLSEQADQATVAKFDEMLVTAEEIKVKMRGCFG